MTSQTPTEDIVAMATTKELKTESHKQQLNAQIDGDT
jgi:hypothetical protein